MQNMQEAEEMFKVKMSNETKEYAKMAVTCTGSIILGYVFFFILTLL
jgi:hypothetical protein